MGPRWQAVLLVAEHRRVNDTRIKRTASFILSFQSSLGPVLIKTVRSFLAVFVESTWKVYTEMTSMTDVAGLWWCSSSVDLFAVAGSVTLVSFSLQHPAVCLSHFKCGKRDSVQLRRTC